MLDTHVGASVQHCSETQDDGEQFLLPHRPIQRIVWILTGLWGKHDVGIPARAMFESLSNLFGMCRLIVQ